MRKMFATQYRTGPVGRACRGTIGRRGGTRADAGCAPRVRGPAERRGPTPMPRLSGRGPRPVRPTASAFAPSRSRSYPGHGRSDPSTTDPSSRRMARCRSVVMEKGRRWSVSRTTSATGPRDRAGRARSTPCRAQPIAGRGGGYSTVTPAISTLLADGPWTSTADCGRSTAITIRLPFIAYIRSRAVSAPITGMPEGRRRHRQKNARCMRSPIFRTLSGT